jgi:hypothetical protein
MLLGMFFCTGSLGGDGNPISTLRAALIRIHLHGMSSHRTSPKYDSNNGRLWMMMRLPTLIFKASVLPPVQSSRSLRAHTSKPNSRVREPPLTHGPSAPCSDQKRPVLDLDLPLCLTVSLRYLHLSRGPYVGQYGCSPSSQMNWLLTELSALLPSACVPVSIDMFPARQPPYAAWLGSYVNPRPCVTSNLTANRGAPELNTAFSLPHTLQKLR